MSRGDRIPNFTPTDNHFAIVEQLRALIDERVGREASFEDRQRVTRVVVNELVWLLD